MLKPVITTISQEEYDKLINIAKEQFKKGFLRQETPYAVAKKAIQEYIQKYG